MRCEQVRKQLAEMSRPMHTALDLELKEHVAECDACRRAFDDRTALDTTFAQMRAEVAASGPSDRVEERVFAELNGAGLALRPAWIVRTWTWVGAGALVCAAVFVAVMLMTSRPTAPHGVGVVATQPVSTLVDEPFTAMPYVVPPAPYERTTVVRTEVPLQTMVAAGFEVHGTDLSSRTQADVLYGEDGRILAIRLISHTNNFSTKRMD